MSHSPLQNVLSRGLGAVGHFSRGIVARPRAAAVLFAWSRVAPALYSTALTHHLVGCLYPRSALSISTVGRSFPPPTHPHKYRAHEPQQSFAFRGQGAVPSVGDAPNRSAQQQQRGHLHGPILSRGVVEQWARLRYSLERAGQGHGTRDTPLRRNHLGAGLQLRQWAGGRGTRLTLPSSGNVTSLPWRRCRSASTVLRIGSTSGWGHASRRIGPRSQRCAGSRREIHPDRKVVRRDIGLSLVQNTSRMHVEIR